ncbi:Z1 domain-containing protein [Nocardia cyriacigeorgica]|uniref:Z1 domain-containing protein n=1 Tax=Nocardia cyriacigeorgica TaxID=135487 RepID=UPI00245834D2|nr:Z1 domain-containing protein [Nocardia cyriacigeorgica]
MTSDTALRIELHTAVLADMVGSRPKRLARAMAYQAEDLPDAAERYADETDFRETLLNAQPGDPIVDMWRKQLTQWDFAVAPAWSSAAARTDERRADIYRLLAIDTSTAKLLEALIPVSKAELPVVISKVFVPWYDSVGQRGRPWYWPAYRQLLRTKGWSDEAIEDLNVATDNVVERLADPASAMAYQSKGLVVGYVQSGKTANFTGVIAKAVDAGYRLIIVLGGTLNLLRAQTQRRLDMELVGRENILRGASEFDSDYADDPDWARGRFVEFGGLPSALGAFDIVRMTTRDNDYKSLLQGIVALEFEKQEPALPLYDARNLYRSSARLMVVKKNKTVLSKLVKDLNKIKTPLSEIPVLIIDDESDEASVNTSRPKPDAERTAINQKISELLTMLPRAQYVGYTATPYANVFIDPSDTADIFPKDFIISLPRPAGYMGASDFHDLDSDIPEDERTVANSNELAHVRDVVVADDDDIACLQQAMDMFVLTAAMKLFRTGADGLGEEKFKHHTMLIHEANWVDSHRELLARATKLWWNAGYLGEAGHRRLRALFDTDLAPVSAARAGNYSVPQSYDELMPYIGPAVMEIGQDNKPIIVVNGDKDIETGEADFDKRRIWKILIGGQKLSRGFTVEGLTISYFRRRAANVSALMQMGRWFGFREGYRDLVRLYIGREEQGSGANGIDLYRAFEAVCMDEDAFRAELVQYATPIDGSPQLTPAKVPPLVSQHLPLLRPTSPNKMYNAQLIEIRSPGRWREPFAYPTSSADLRHNTALWEPVFDRLSDSTTDFAYHFADRGRVHRLSALTGLLSADEFLDIVESNRWRAPAQFAPHLEYLRSISTGAARQVDDWVVLAPQRPQRDKEIRVGSRLFTRWERVRRRDPLFGAISTNRHRSIAIRIAGGLPSCDDPATEGLVRPRRGAVMVHPVVEPRHRGDISADMQIDPGKLVMAFGFVAPASATGRDGHVIRFTAVDSGDDSAIVEVGDGADG